MHCTILKYNALPKCIECCGQASALGTSEKNGFKRADNHHNMDSIIPSNIIATIMCFRISSNSNRYTLIAMYVGGPKHTVDSQRSQWKQTIKTCWCTFCKNNSCQKHNLCAFHTKSCLETDFSRIEIHEVIMNITRVFTALLFALQRGTDILSPGPAETLGITFFNCHCSRLFSECFVLPQQQQKQHDKSQF